MWSRSVRLAARGLVLVLLAEAPSSAFRAQEPAPFAELRASLERRLGEQRVPSLAVAVAQDGKVLWEDAVGWANVEERVPATPDTPYLLASVSKPITATALMVLVERGKMYLDRPVDEYLGEAKLRACVGDAAQATLRRLADHTSGLARHDLYAYASDPGAPVSYERDLPVELWFDDSGAIRVQLEDQPVAVAGGVRIEDGYLRGSIDGDLGTSDTKGCRYRLHFKLRLREDGVLNGSLTASSAAGERVFTLSHWMDVRRRP